MRFPHLLLVLCLCCAPAPSMAQDMGLPALLQITEAGGSLILEMDKKHYSVTELARLAASLKYEATLTIRLGTAKLTPAQCAQIARARPGQVIFWF